MAKAKPVHELPAEISPKAVKERAEAAKIAAAVLLKQGKLLKSRAGKHERGKFVKRWPGHKAIIEMAPAPFDGQFEFRVYEGEKLVELGHSKSRSMAEYAVEALRSPQGPGSGNG